MKKLIASLLVLAPLMAAAYPIDVTIVSKGLDVSCLLYTSPSPRD